MLHLLSIVKNNEAESLISQNFFITKKLDRDNNDGCCANWICRYRREKQ